MKLKVNSRTYLCDVSRIGEVQVGDQYVIEDGSSQALGGGFVKLERFRPVWEVLYKLGDVLKVRRANNVYPEINKTVTTLVLWDGRATRDQRKNLIGGARPTPRDREIFLFRRKAGE